MVDVGLVEVELFVNEEAVCGREGRFCGAGGKGEEKRKNGEEDGGHDCHLSSDNLWENATLSQFLYSERGEAKLGN